MLRRAEVNAVIRLKLRVLLLILGAASCGWAGVFNFSNTGAITIPDSGAASPYPSTIAVSGTGTVAKVTVTLLGLSHTFPSDIDVLLVGPTGANLLLLSDVGGSTAISGVNLTFDDAAGGPLPVPGVITSGTYQPTNNGIGDVFNAPAPAGPYGSTLSVFNGTNPTGTWLLYIMDDAVQDQGSLSGGWSLAITDAGGQVPEPGTVALLLGGLIGLVALGRRRRLSR
jgi:subtilisin-like proprotein convertase family protein